MLVLTLNGVIEAEKQELLERKEKKNKIKIMRYKNMRLQEIEQRLAAIKIEIDDGADLDVLETEIRALKEERKVSWIKLRKERIIDGNA